ncbi:11S globulin seed storage protein 2-like isoform X1 [Telopea speciosissima]|uniref:11S globulin seed storage protein 2-like isoform X1 n=1 Tax=Telopea speciosissima TaxID=54955 RepID=UPI001CC5C7F3|nr:11S globulin seed storage protein 2-like isoform X1 [Telopea speciosissima]
MELELGPKVAQAAFEGEGGSYHCWLSSEFPILRQTKLGGGKLVLNPLGLALPHYADSSKIGYVIQGKGRFGIVLANASEEKVVEIGKGDSIPLPLGTITWWFNDDETDQLIIVFLGDTSKAHIPGDFTYFFLAGDNSIFKGFSTDFVSRAFDLDEEEANKIVKSQPGVLIINLKEGKKDMPQPCKAHREEIIFNIETALPDVDIKNGGREIGLFRGKFPFLGEVNFSAKHVRLNGNAMCAPEYSSDSAVQVIYIVKGSGSVQVVGIEGERVLDTMVKAGDLFVVPSFFVVSKIAGDEGMECFSIITTTEPVFSYLAGKTSVWKALSPKVLQVSLNLIPRAVEVFTSKMSENAIFIPAPRS